ncbi:hypothetical protein ABEX38_29970 [Priestia megaterium]
MKDLTLWNSIDKDALEYATVNLRVVEDSSYIILLGVTANNEVMVLGVREK